MTTADWQTLASFIKDGVTIAAAIVAIYVAIAGLSAWRKQLAGTTEYEAARRLLKATYTLREAINTVRSPFMGAGEIARAMKQAGIESLPGQFEVPPAATRAAYQERWKFVSDAMSSLAAEAFEAEVLWGDEVQSVLKPLRSCVAELYGALTIYLDSLSHTHSQVLPDEEHKRIDATVYSTYDPNTDKLYKEVLNSIAAIDRFVRPYLKSGSAKKSQGTASDRAERKSV